MLIQFNDRQKGVKSQKTTLKETQKMTVALMPGDYTLSVNAKRKVAGTWTTSVTAKFKISVSFKGVFTQ